MPLFKRHDGDLVRGETPMRRIMPYLMPSRNGSIVLNDSVFQIQDTRIWLKAYNRAHEEHATLFHLLAYAAAQALHERPELNRFVSGGRVYQRRGVQVSFVVKKELKDEGQSTTVKLNVIHGEPFRVFADRLAKAIREAQDTDRAVDRETALIMQLPGFLVRGLVALARGLDRWNLFPRFMTEPDPMFSSIFLANLGSAGISDAYHHLYEYGTVSIFGAMSAPCRMPFVEDDNVVVRPGLRVRWSFDERIHDAFYSARSLNLVRRIVEAPLKHLGAPEGDPAFSVAGSRLPDR
ncbi:MAG: 2-oxo acid dehydrogenase subunit E2 [Gemmatimonadota bacterium]